MKLLSRSLQSLTLDQWRLEYLKPANRNIQETRLPDVVIETSWVGLCLGNENPPLPFLVRVMEKTPRKGDNKTVQSRWFPTERAAINHHQMLEAEFLPGKD